jgi:hypothetical protein
MQKNKRVYLAINGSQAAESDFVMINGRESYDPLPVNHNVDIQSIETLEKNGYRVNREQNRESGSYVESGTIELKMSIGVADDGQTPLAERVIVRVGKSTGAIFIEDEDLSALVVDGTAGDKTLALIDRLAQEGKYLKLKGVHTEASDTKHFLGSVKVKGYTHDGDRLKDENKEYPLAGDNQENENIRIQNDLNVVLDGQNWIEYAIDAGVSVNKRFKTDWCR